MIRADGLVLRGRDGRRTARIGFVVDGGVVGVVGPSGGGKSLLLLALAGLAPGAVVGGSAVVDRDVGLVFANDALDDARTALGNVVDAAVAAGVASPVSQASVLLQRLGIDRAAQQRLPRALSGGQRKRVGLARALVIRPRTLLLDDPTAGLDPITARQIVDVVEGEVAAVGACALFATQDVDTVLPRLRRALWLRRADEAADAGTVDVAALPSPFAPRPYPPFLEGAA